MRDPRIAPRSEAAARGQGAEAELAKILEDGGWRVRSHSAGAEAHDPDMIIRRGNFTYAMKVKAASMQLSR